MVYSPPSSQNDLFQWKSDGVILLLKSLTPFLTQSENPNPNNGLEDLIPVVLTWTGN